MWKYCNEIVALQVLWLNFNRADSFSDWDLLLMPKKLSSLYKVKLGTDTKKLSGNLQFN